MVFLYLVEVASTSKGNAVQDQNVALKGNGNFYGWRVLWASTAAMMLYCGLFYYGFSAFFLPLEQDFGWERAAIAVAASIAQIENGLFGPFCGLFIDRLGTRRTMLFGFAWMGLGFLLFSLVDSLLTLYLVFILFLSVGGGFIFPAGNAAVAKWFTKRRTFGFGILQTGWALGGLVVPLLVWAISSYGWRGASLFAGVALLIIGIPISLTLKEASTGEEDASDKGLAHAAQQMPISQGVSNALLHESASSQDREFSGKEAVKTPAFWILAVAFALQFMASIGFTVHMIPIFVGTGLAPELAGLMLSVVTVLSIPGRLFFGLLGDRFSKKYLLAICLVMQAAALVILANIGNLWLLVPFLLLYTPSYGGSMPLVHGLRADFFGQKAFATIQGFNSFVSVWGSMLGPIIAGRVFDTQRSYYWVLLGFAVLFVMSTSLVLKARAPLKKSVVGIQKIVPA